MQDVLSVLLNENVEPVAVRDPRWGRRQHAVERERRGFFAAGSVA